MSKAGRSIVAGLRMEKQAWFDIYQHSGYQNQYAWANFRSYCRSLEWWLAKAPDWFPQPKRGCYQ